MIRDRYTGICWAYPFVEKYRDEVIYAVNHFNRLGKVKTAYADKAPVFEGARKHLEFPSIIHCRIALRTSAWLRGPIFHDDRYSHLYAVECVGHLVNIECGEDEKSPWCKQRSKEFHGEEFVLGAKVYVMPSAGRNNLNYHERV